MEETCPVAAKAHYIEGKGAANVGKNWSGLELNRS